LLGSFQQAAQALATVYTTNKSIYQPPTNMQNNLSVIIPMEGKGGEAVSPVLQEQLLSI
jgi:hypothetical protein